MKAGLPSRPRRVRVPALLLSLLMLAAAGTQAAEPVLTLHYQERPPYSSRGPDDHPQGLLIAPLVRALDQAGIVRNWVLTPGQRQLATIQSGAGRRVRLPPHVLAVEGPPGCRHRATAEPR